MSRRAFFAWERGGNGCVSPAIYYDEQPKKHADKLAITLVSVEIPGGTDNGEFFPAGAANLDALARAYPQPAFE